MTQTSSLDDDKPIDPEFLRVQARLRKLMLIAGLTLGLGMFAVFAAILYKIVTLDATPSAGEGASTATTFSAADLGVPADARLVSTAADQGRIVLTYQHSGGHTVILIDAGSRAVVGRLNLSGQ